MSIVPPSEGGSQGSSYRRRVAAGTARPIRWDRLQDLQRENVRNLFGRNQWRRVVDAIISNQDHYNETGEGQDVYDYKQKIADALGWDDDRWSDFEDDNPDDVESITWYHAKKG